MQASSPPTTHSSITDNFCSHSECLHQRCHTIKPCDGYSSCHRAVSSRPSLLHPAPHEAFPQQDNHSPVDRYPPNAINYAASHLQAHGQDQAQVIRSSIAQVYVFLPAVRPQSPSDKVFDSHSHYDQRPSLSSPAQP